MFRHDIRTDTFPDSAWQIRLFGGPVVHAQFVRLSRRNGAGGVARVSPAVQLLTTHAEWRVTQVPGRGAGRVPSSEIEKVVGRRSLEMERQLTQFFPCLSVNTFLVVCVAVCC